MTWTPPNKGGGGGTNPIDPTLDTETIVKYDPTSQTLKEAEIGDTIGGSLAITQDAPGNTIIATEGQVITFSELSPRTTVVANNVTCTVDFGDPGTYVGLDEVKSLEIYVNPSNGGLVNLNIDPPLVWDTYETSTIPVREPYRAMFEMFNTSSEKGGLVSAVPILHPTRRKTEMRWSGLTGVTLTQGVSQNLIALLESLPTPDYGSFSPFLNTTSDKLNVFNANASVLFKVDIDGSFAGGGGGSRRIVIDFLGTDNTLVDNQSAGLADEPVNAITFLSIDRDGNIATNGTEMTIVAEGNDYTINTILIVVEQVTNTSNINIV